MNYDQIGAILAEQDIFGYGTYESHRVSSVRPPVPASYSNVVDMFAVNDPAALYEEATQAAEQIGANYFKRRVENLPNGITPEIMRETMTELGFVRGKYQGYGLRVDGTTELLPIVGEKTKALLDGMPCPIFRQQYAMAEDGWNIKYHIDHADYRVHGFRCIIPLNAPAYIVFREGDRNALYVLNVGRAYFINIASLHRAFYFGTEARCALMMQMATDQCVIEGAPCDPSPWDGIPDVYRDFNEVSAILGR